MENGILYNSIDNDIVYVGVDLGLTGALSFTNAVDTFYGCIKFSSESIITRPAKRIVIGQTKTKPPRPKYKIVEKAKKANRLNVSKVRSFVKETLKDYEGEIRVYIEEPLFISGFTRANGYKQMCLISGMIYSIFNEYENVTYRLESAKDIKNKLKLDKDKEKSLELFNKVFNEDIGLDDDIAESALISCFDNDYLVKN